MRQTPKSRHTPGPWHIINEKTIVGADSPRQGYVADVNLHRSSDNGEPDGFANAALIAAAPELLAIIKDMRQAFYVEGTRKALLQVMERSKDIIAKSEGRQS